jgi:Kef-type K+ transport system membrane component KefB
LKAGVILIFLCATIASAQSQQVPMADSGLSADSASLDSTAATPLELQLRRGVAANLAGRASESIALIAPLLDSVPAEFTLDQRREAVRALGASYFREREYREAAQVYIFGIASLESALDSLTRTPPDTAAEASAVIKTLTSPESVVPPSPERIPKELGFIALLFALFLLPKALQRYRIPGAVTSLLMGLAASALGWFPHDPTLALLSTLGIVALFLFAGLEIDGSELQRNVRPLVLHAAIWTALAAVTAVAASLVLGLSLRVAALLSLALVTPSTGFILSSLKSFGLSDSEQRTVRTYAVGSELIALAALFFVLQSTSLQHLALAIAAMVVVVVLIPLAFRVFASVVAPYAPRSEFAFLLMVAVMCAYATRLLGVYYLVGAFLVGVAAQRFRANHPAMSSEKMVDALESFGSVFIPFYFFHAGTEIVSDQLTLKALGLGLLLVVVFVPVRIGVIALHRRIALKENFAVSRRVASAMVPTLVFTLVIAAILQDRFAMPGTMAGALVLYTILNTTMPAFVLRAAPADFEDVEALPLKTPAVAD